MSSRIFENSNNDLCETIHTHTNLTTDIHKVHFHLQRAGASRGRWKHRGTAVSDKLE